MFYTDNIIMWRETSNDSLSGPVGVDFALSFQEVQGCAEIWFALNLFIVKLISFQLIYYNQIQSANRKAIGNMQAQVAQSRSYNRMEAGQGNIT